MLQIYHNNRCGKSRNCVSILEKKGLKFEIILYLTNSPTFDDLENLINKLNCKPIDLVRQNEKIWIDAFKSQLLNDEQVIKAMVSYPILIQRPILILNNKALIARDEIKIMEFLQQNEQHLTFNY